jgi:hypothetical protein
VLFSERRPKIRVIHIARRGWPEIQTTSRSRRRRKVERWKGKFSILSDCLRQA